jgi:DNA polymerase-3 subunit delta'
VLLLTADEPENLLPTVASRCELLRLRPMPLEELADELAARQGLETEKARLIAHVAGGRPGYALRLAADESLLVARDEWLADFFSLLGAKQRERLAYSEKHAKGKDRADTRAALRDGLIHWLSLWRDVLLSASQSGAPLTNLDRREQIQALADAVEQEKAARLVMRLEHAFARLATANLQLMLDNLLLEWPRA